MADKKERRLASYDWAASNSWESTRAEEAQVRELNEAELKLIKSAQDKF